MVGKAIPYGDRLWIYQKTFSQGHQCGVDKEIASHYTMTFPN